MIHDFDEVNDFDKDIPFHEFIRKKRRLLGLNQTDFGKMIGVHQKTISFWECNEYSPTMDQAQQIVEKLGGRIRIENVKDIEPKDVIPFYPYGFNPWQE